MIAAYRLSPECTELAPRTRADYERIMLWMNPIQGIALAQIDTPFVVHLRDKAFAKHKRRFANYVRDLLAIIFGSGKKRGWMRNNPTADCPRIRRPRDAPDPNRPWTPLELDCALMAASAGVHAAIALGHELINGISSSDGP